MKLTRLAGTCNDLNTCPAVDLTEAGTLVLTGPAVSYAELRAGAGEGSVELTVDLVREALRALDNR
jgi:hypothetical protein